MRIINPAFNDVILEALKHRRHELSDLRDTEQSLGVADWESAFAPRLHQLAIVIGALEAEMLEPASAA